MGSPTTAGTLLHKPAQLEYLWSFWGKASAPEVLGPLPEGIRINVFLVEGEITGSRLRARFRAGGVDAFVLRPDGVGLIDVRATLESNDGAVIYMTYTGVAELGTDGYRRFLQNDAPPVVELRIAPRFSTSHPDYLWLNRLQCVGVGQVDMQTMMVSYDIYALR